MDCQELSNNFCTKEECQSLDNRLTQAERLINSLELKVEELNRHIQQVERDLEEHKSKDVPSAHRINGNVKVGGSVSGKELNITVAVEPIGTDSTNINIPFCSEEVCDELERRINEVKNGRDGKDGKDGKDGEDGKDGLDGLPGKDGKDGNDGRDGERGEKGEKGDKGDKGDCPTINRVQDGVEIICDGTAVRVFDGRDGDNGRDGIDGIDGKNGRDGSSGIDGKDGKDGANGSNGSNGKDGVDGKDGINGKDGEKGEKGDPGIDAFPPDFNDTFIADIQLSYYSNELIVIATRNDGVSLFGQTTLPIIGGGNMGDTTEITNKIEECCNKLDNKLDDLKKKLEFNSQFLFGVHCEDPTNPFDDYFTSIGNDVGYEFHDIPTGFQAIKQMLNDIHNDVCKAILPKVEISHLPAPYICAEKKDENGESTGEFEVRPMTIEDDPTSEYAIAQAGIANFIGTKVIFPFLLNKLLSVIYEQLNQAQKNTLDVVCENVDTDPLILLPDPIAVFNTQGIFMAISWVLEENPDTKVYQGHTQLRFPIKALYEDPDLYDSNWDTYLSGIYKIMGNQWASYWGNDSNTQPLIKGYFRDVEEAHRLFNQMKNLTQILPRNINNPSYPQHENLTTQVTNQGKKLVPRKIAILKKDIDTDKIECVVEYFNPNLR